MREPYVEVEDDGSLSASIATEGDEDVDIVEDCLNKGPDNHNRLEQNNKAACSRGALV